MKHLFVPYEIALKLKEKGFDEPCLGYYSPHNLNYVYHDTIYSNIWEEFKGSNNGLPVPLYQQVIDWFREKHKLMLIQSCVPSKNNSLLFGFIIQYLNELEEAGTSKVMIHRRERNTSGYESYYEALNKAIEEALKLI